jgi:hypothetical protein
MTAWAEIGNTDLNAIVVTVCDAHWGSVINLEGHMRAKPELRVFGQWPILDAQSDLQVSVAEKTAVRGADQFQARGVAA